MNYTPGPWRTSSRAVANSDIGAEIAVRSKNGLVAIACTINEGAVNAEANARLIAAAPELLEALRDLLPILDNDGPLPRVYADVGKRAEAVIARAMRVG